MNYKDTFRPFRLDQGHPLDNRPYRQAATNAVVLEALLGHTGGIEDIAPIENHRIFQRPLDYFKVRRFEVLPFRNNNQAVGALQGCFLSPHQTQVRM